MGYQVGRICYKTEAEAANAVMTQVVPTADKDGVLHHPVFNGRTWEYHGKTVQLTFPQCDYGAYYELGLYAGNQIAGALAVLFVIVVTLKALNEIR